MFLQVSWCINFEEKYGENLSKLLNILKIMKVIAGLTSILSQLKAEQELEPELMIEKFTYVPIDRCWYISDISLTTFLIFSKSIS